MYQVNRHAECNEISAARKRKWGSVINQLGAAFTMRDMSQRLLRLSQVQNLWTFVYCMSLQKSNEQ